MSAPATTAAAARVATAAEKRRRLDSPEYGRRVDAHMFVGDLQTLEALREIPLELLRIITEYVHPCRKQFRNVVRDHVYSHKYTMRRNARGALEWACDECAHTVPIPTPLR